MRPDRDPVRLADPRSDIPASLRSALRAAEDDLPSPQKLAELVAKGPSGSPPSGSPPSGSGAPAPKGSGLPAPPAYPSIVPGIVAGAALGLAVVGASSWLLPGRADAPPPTRVEVVAASPPPVEIHPAPQQEAARPAPPPSQGASAPRTTGSEWGRPLLTTRGGDSAEATEAAEAAPAPSPEAAKESELSLLRRAQSVLSASPSAALGLANEHAARFPGGLFSQEREVIAITALAGMGRRAEAEARARRFLSAHPTSAHRRRIEEIVPSLKNDVGDQKTTEPAPSTPEPH